MSNNTTIIEIEKLKQQLDSLRPLKPESEEKLWKKLRMEWNYNSNHMEGNTLTYGETELLLLFDRTTGDHTKREYDEMQAHDVAIKMVRELAEENERPLTEAFIRKLNEVILVKPYWKEAITPEGQPTRREIKIGEYKSFPNSVRLQNGEMFHYASPEETPAKMHGLMDWYSGNLHLHPIVIAAMFHYQLVRIHPFDDGNGRVARLIMNFILMKNGYVPIVIKSKEKNQYLAALNKADTGLEENFVQYITEQLSWSLNLAIKAANGESIDEGDDIDKEINLLSKKINAKGKINKSPKIIYSIFEHMKDQLWSSLRKELNQFNSVFSESRETHFVNGMEHYYETRLKNIVQPSFMAETSDKPREPKIFGHSIYEINIDNVEWNLKWFALKGINHVRDYDIILQILFSIDNYTAVLKIDGKKILEEKKDYKHLIDPEESREIIKLVKMAFIELINQELIQGDKIA